MKKLISSIFHAIALTAALSSAAQTPATVESLMAELSNAGNTADSVKIMYDIFDLSPKKSQATIAWQMLEMAERTNNNALGLDMIRHLANTYHRNDSIYALLEAKCLAYPPTDDRLSTHTFITLRRAEYIARYASEQERLDKIKEIMQSYRNDSPQSNQYERVQQLGSLCILLGNNTHGALISKYIDQSIAEVNKLPSTDFAVRNLIYNQAANIFTNLHQPEKAIAIDHELLNVMDWMADQYRNSGRIYRNFDRIRFTTYRNMLQNYEGLTDHEIQQFHDSITAIAARNDEVAKAMKLNIANAYYMMATRQYAKAIPLLKEILDRPTDNFNRMRLLSNIIKAAEAVNDEETLLEYTEQYNDILEEYITLSSQETYNEFQTIYDVNRLQMQNTTLQLERSEAKLRHQRTLIIGGIVICLVMMAVLLILARLIRKSRKLAANLSESNNALRQERNNLLDTQQNLITARDDARRAEQLKSKFIENVSSEITTPLDAIVEYSNLIVDCADSDKRKYLTRYADIVKLNTELLSNTVHDILEVRRLESPTLTIQRKPVNIGEICRMAVDSVRPSAQPGVTVTFDCGDEPDISITSDAHRIEQVLINLLSNAAKFTYNGKISLSYIVDRSNNSLTFAVTDTGIGVPEGKEEEIFGRFRKLHDDVAGTGLGLPICRMIANLMHGTVTLDRSYNIDEKNSGCRFLYTIPLID